jgi:hypothetical protein
MWTGALRTRHRSAYAALIALLLGAGTFLAPGKLESSPSLAGIRYFRPVIDALQHLLPGMSGAQICGFLAFAYSYHYLNWFSKANVIRWNYAPRPRMLMLIALYALFESAYAFSYTIGFTLSLFLSLLHVLLEFPLNIRTFGSLWASLTPLAPAPCRGTRRTNV